MAGWPDAGMLLAADAVPRNVDLCPIFNFAFAAIDTASDFERA